MQPSFAFAEFLLTLRCMPSVVLVLLAILSAAPSLLGQYTVKRLVFRNAGRYTQPQLEAAAALKPGEHIGTKEMGEASQRLMDTGVFDDIEVTVNGPLAAVDVVFKLKPADPTSFLPVTYQNLVWLSDEERDAGVKQRVPLFTGGIPAAGTLQVSVQKALQDMLAAKGITGTVETERRYTSAATPTPYVLYRVSTPSVMLDSVKLTGIGIDFGERENKALRGMVGRSYVFGSGADLAARLLQPLRNAGYLDAKIERLQLTPAPAVDGVVKLTVAGDVVTGQAYRIGSVEWSGSPVFSVEDFAKGNKLHAGDSASDELLKQSYAPLTIAYLKHGYLDARIDVNAVRDETARTVTYTLRATPGEVYHVGSVSAVGLDPKTRQDFDAAWSMHPGDVYDATYPGRFLASGKIPSLQRYTASINAAANPATHLEDVLLTFTPAAR